MPEAKRPVEMTEQEIRSELVTYHDMSRYEIDKVLTRILNSSVPDGLENVMLEYHMKNGHELTRVGELLLMLATRHSV